MTIRIGHLSDIHVPAGIQPSFRDLMGKRITGYLNFKWRREKEYDPQVLQHAVKRLIEAKVDLVIVSGDLSNLAYHQEFDQANLYLSPLDHAHIPYLVIPGNHDRYLARATDGYMEALFHEHLGTPLDPPHPYPWIYEHDDATIIGLNSAVPNAPFQAWGHVSERQLRALDQLTQRLPPSPKPRIVTVHHHIGQAPHKKRDHNRNLRNSDAVLAHAKALDAQLILHGHNHFLDVRNVDGIRVFAASSGISNQHGQHRRAGQVAIHTLHQDTPPTHEVAFWQGTSFGDWIPMDEASLPPDRNAYFSQQLPQ